jgi:hypothetical protein
MIDINTIFNQLLNAAIVQATQPLVERIAALETRLTEASLFQKETNVTVDMDALRELVTPLVGSMVEAKIEEAINAHCEEYDHDRYDNIANEVDDLPDFDDFVRGDELDSNVRDAVRDLTFEVSVS